MTALAKISPVDRPVPAPGEAVPVADGILWMRMPLPLRLNHVNLWALEDDDGWTLVDCGPQTDACRSAWIALLDGPLQGRPVKRLVATHGHLDHVGLAGWLVEHLNIPFVSTLGEWQAARLRHLEGSSADPNGRDFLLAHGCDETMVDQWLSQRSTMLALLGRQPESLVRIRGEDEVDFGGRRWRVIAAGGHASEHASFYCEADRILIAGDQILPRITPVIGVFSDQPEADPLSDYLDSLPRFAALAQDSLVLPSHGLPFRGLHDRRRSLVAHHDERLARVLDFAGKRATAWEIAGGLFARAVSEGQERLALAETLAHLHRLLTTGDLVRGIDRAGRVTFAGRG